MKEYAKIYQSPKYGQIVVINHTNDEGYPAVETFFQADGLGVSSFSVVFGPKNGEKKWDEDKACELCDSAYAAITAESAEAGVSKVMELMV